MGDVAVVDGQADTEVVTGSVKWTIAGYQIESM